MEVIPFALIAAAEIRDPLMPLWVMELTARVLLYVWLFALGATVGSFLNVVVYRLPRRLDLAIPGSFCPHCGHPIRLSDNVPIVSWLALRGRCRDCGGRISPRYFVVESLVATTFLVILAGEHWLPTGVLGFATRRVLTPYDGAAFWAAYGLHLVLVVTVYAAVLIAGDGFRAPRRLYGPALVAGVVLPLIWPQVRSVPAFHGWHLGWQAGLIDGAIGMLAGVIVGLMAVALFYIPRLRFGFSYAASVAPVCLVAAVGLVFGWQRALWMGPVVLLVSAGTVAGLRAIPSAAKEGPAPAAEPVATPEIAATTGAMADPETISEEVHIISPPTEPTEPS